MRSRYASLALAVVVLLVVTAGCGGSKKKSSSAAAANTSTPAATTAATTAAETTSADTTASSTKTSSSSSSSNADKAALTHCPQLAQLGAKYAAALQAANASAGNDPAKATENTAAIFDKLVGDAPSEIRGDLKAFSKVLHAYAAVLAKTHFQPGKVPTAAQLAALQKASQSFNSAELQKASAHLQAWVQSHCK